MDVDKKREEAKDAATKEELKEWPSRTDGILKDEDIDLEEGFVVVLKTIARPDKGTRKRIQDVICWPIGRVDEDTSNIVLFDRDEAKERKLVNIERNEEGDKGNKTCTARCQRLCNRKARVFCLKNPEPIGNVTLKLNPMPTESEENPPPALEDRDIQIFKEAEGSKYWYPKDGILYILKKYDDNSFRFLEAGRLENGKVYQREKLALKLFLRLCI